MSDFIASNELLEILKERIYKSAVEAGDMRMSFIEKEIFGSLIDEVLASRLAKAAAVTPESAPVGEIVAWSGTNRDMGITRDIDFRFLRFDVKPGTKLYAVETAPAAKSDLLMRAEALAVETRALASRIQAGE